MTGPTAAISVTVALPGAFALPPLLSVGAQANPLGAVPTLATFVDLMIGEPQVAPKSATPGIDRQDDAATGNILPDDKEDETSDPALAWLMAAPVASAPAPIARVVPTGDPAVAPAALDAEAKAMPSPLPRPIDPRRAPETKTLPGTVAVVAEVNIAAPPPVTLPTATPVSVEATDTGPAEAIVTTPLEAPVRSAAVRPERVAPAPQGQPSAQTIAAAMLRTPQAQPVTLARVLAANPNAQPALFALAMDRTSEDRDTKPVSAATTAAALLQPADAAALIARPGEAQRQALDMGQPDWPQKMIDRIETLRDAANANDTSIRLKPEALGRVDISLKSHADGAVSVRFTAEQPATRTLLADSAPQLTAAAEARGIRLSQTSVDLAGSGQGDRQRPPFELQQNNSNRLAAGETETDAVTDGRVA